MQNTGALPMTDRKFIIHRLAYDVDRLDARQLLRDAQPENLAPWALPPYDTQISTS